MDIPAVGRVFRFYDAGSQYHHSECLRLHYGGKPPPRPPPRSYSRFPLLLRIAPAAFPADRFRPAACRKSSAVGFAVRFGTLRKRQAQEIRDNRAIVTKLNSKNLPIFEKSSRIGVKQIRYEQKEETNRYGCEPL